MGISRRNLLKALGIGAGAAAVAPLMPEGAQAVVEAIEPEIVAAREVPSLYRGTAMHYTLAFSGVNMRVTGSAPFYTSPREDV